MKFAKTIIYVSDVPTSLAFFEKAFGLKTRFFQEAGYGELETGASTLAFASYQAGQYHLPEGYSAEPMPAHRMNYEIALHTESVEEAFKRAVDAGAQPLQQPEKKPWGQTVSYVRCPDGTFVDLSSPVGW